MFVSDTTKFSKRNIIMTKLVDKLRRAASQSLSRSPEKKSPKKRPLLPCAESDFAFRKEGGNEESASSVEEFVNDDRPRHFNNKSNSNSLTLKNLKEGSHRLQEDALLSDRSSLCRNGINEEDPRNLFDNGGDEEEILSQEHRDSNNRTRLSDLEEGQHHAREGEGSGTQQRQARHHPGAASAGAMKSVDEFCSVVPGKENDYISRNYGPGNANGNASSSSTGPRKGKSSITNTTSSSSKNNFSHNRQNSNSNSPQRQKNNLPPKNSADLLYDQLFPEVSKKNRTSKD